MIRALILAAGEGTRWGLHTGVPKHLVEVDGRRLLDRTVDQFADLDGIGDVVIVAPSDHRYRSDRARTSWAVLDPRNFEADRFHSSLFEWDRNMVMVCAFGDVWYSDQAIRAIGIAARRPSWSWVARFDGSQLTGKPQGEGFALVVPPRAQDHVLRTLHDLTDDRKANRITRALGWDLYRRLAGIPVSEHRRGPGFVEVNDWTDDFDTPEDYDRWVERRRAAGLAG